MSIKIVCTGTLCLMLVFPHLIPELCSDWSGHKKYLLSLGAVQKNIGCSCCDRKKAGSSTFFLKATALYAPSHRITCKNMHRCSKKKKRKNKNEEKKTHQGWKQPKEPKLNPPIIKLYPLYLTVDYKCLAWKLILFTVGIPQDHLARRRFLMLT